MMILYFKFFIITLCLLKGNPIVLSKMAVDVIVAVHGNFFRDQAKLDNVRETLLELPSEIDEMKVRTALITSHGTTCDVRLNLTGSYSKYLKAIASLKTVGRETEYHDLRIIFSIIRERLLPHSNRPIAIIIFSDDPLPQHMDDAVIEAKRLRFGKPSAMMFLIHSAPEGNKFAEMIGDVGETYSVNDTFTKGIFDDIMAFIHNEYFCINDPAIWTLTFDEFFYAFSIELSWPPTKTQFFCLAIIFPLAFLFRKKIQIDFGPRNVLIRFRFFDDDDDDDDDDGDAVAEIEDDDDMIWLDAMADDDLEEDEEMAPVANFPVGPDGAAQGHLTVRKNTNARSNFVDKDENDCRSVEVSRHIVDQRGLDNLIKILADTPTNKLLANLQEQYTACVIESTPSDDKEAL